MKRLEINEIGQLIGKCLNLHNVFANDTLKNELEKGKRRQNNLTYLTIINIFRNASIFVFQRFVSLDWLFANEPLCSFIRF